VAIKTLRFIVTMLALSVLGQSSASQAADIDVLTLKPTIDGFVSKGIALASGRRLVARSGIGIAVPKGAPKPDVSSTASLTSTLHAAKHIGFSTGPSGVYVEKMLAQLNINNLGGEKLVKISKEQVAMPLSRGELTLGLQQMSELLGQPGIEVIGPLPPDVQHYTLVDEALHPRGKNTQAALAFADFLSTPAALSIMHGAGIDGPN
jgi:molybdate transport system substrate-binding protein